MKKLLDFEKPVKIHTTEEHNKMYSSSADAAGTYVPNMSKEDMLKWKAKHITGENERIEIHKTIDGVQVVIIVYKKARPVLKYDYKKKEEWDKRHQSVRMSMNGKLDMTWDNWFDMEQAVKEAFEILL
jgi:hypothetical protein